MHALDVLTWQPHVTPAPRPAPELTTDRAQRLAQPGSTPVPDGGVISDFFHDLPPQLTAEAAARLRDQSSTPFGNPWPLASWPQVPTRVLITRQDRLFPRDFQRQVARRRLGITPDEMDGGHFVALGQPQALGDRLERFTQAGDPGPGEAAGA